MAIIFSAIAFGLIHANLYQFFYATMLGVLLGYIYTSTGKWKHTVFIHMIVNFLGSIVPLVISSMLDEFLTVIETTNLYNTEVMMAYLPEMLIYLLYLSFQMSIILGGAVVLVYYMKNNRLRVSRDKEVNLTDVEIIKNGVSNVGVILFLIVSFILSLISLFLQ